MTPPFFQKKVHRSVNNDCYRRGQQALYFALLLHKTLYGQDDRMGDFSSISLSPCDRKSKERKGNGVIVVIAFYSQPTQQQIQIQYNTKPSF